MPESNIITKTVIDADIKSIDMNNRSVRAMFSTPQIDRDNEIIDAKAFSGSLPSFTKNPILLNMHDPHRVGGSLKDLVVTDAGLEGTAVFAKTALGEELWQLYSAGHMKAFSVGFRSIKSEQRTIEGKRVRAFTEVELLEVSAVSIPANPGALVRSLAGAGMDEDALSKLISTAVGSTVEKALKDLLNAEPGGLVHQLIQDVLDVQSQGLKGAGCGCGRCGSPHDLEDGEGDAAGKAAMTNEEREFTEGLRKLLGK